MKKARKIIAFTLVLLFVLVPIFADQSASNTLHVVAQVPENYGVAFPDNALRFGDFVFEMEIEMEIETELDIDSGKDSGKALIAEDKVSIGDIKLGYDSFDFSLVYYGNLSKPYRTEIVVDPNIIWVMNGDTQISSVPIEVKLKKSANCDGDITCISSRAGQVFIEIPPSGPREGVPVLDVDVSWQGAKDLIPGIYTTELRLDMRVI